MVDQENCRNQNAVLMAAGGGCRVALCVGFWTENATRVQQGPRTKALETEQCQTEATALSIHRDEEVIVLKMNWQTAVLSAQCSVIKEYKVLIKTG